MSVAYKGPTGWLYRVSERPDAKGEYRIEYLDPTASAVYKPLPGYNGSANRAEIAHRLANDCSLKVVEDIPATAAPEPASSPASAEPLEVVDECSAQDTVPAALAAPPAADIAVPGFDFGADEPTNTALLQCAQAFVAGRLAQVMAAKRAHELTANNKNGAFGKWCEAVGISRDTGNNLVNIADNFGNIELNGRPLVEITPISLLAIGSKPSAPLELKRGIESGDITTTKQYRELETQLKAEREGRETAEREKREALAWKQHAEGQAEDAKAAIHAAQQTAQEAQRAAETLKQQIYRRNEELQEKEQTLNAVLDQQGEYIAKIRELEKRPKDVDVVVQQPSEADIERWRKEGEERARADLAGQAPTVEELTTLANGYAAQINGMRAVLAQLSRGMEHQAVTRASDKLCLAADRLHDLILYGPEDYGHG